MTDERKSPASPLLIGYGLIGSEMAGFTVVGVGIDWLAGTTPWATVTLTLFGFVAAFVNLIRMANQRTGGSPST
jgi:F0F1-type ATP synthase assembly protein I